MMRPGAIWATAGRLFPIAWPIFVGQIAVIAYGVIDTAMIARASADDLAALAAHREAGEEIGGERAKRDPHRGIHEHRDHHEVCRQFGRNRPCLAGRCVRRSDHVRDHDEGDTERLEETRRMEDGKCQPDCGRGDRTDPPSLSRAEIGCGRTRKFGRKPERGQERKADITAQSPK